VLPNGTTIAGLTICHENNIGDYSRNQPMRRNQGLRASSSAPVSGLVTDRKAGNELVETKVTILTAMENRVLALVTQAKTNKEIAVVLGISPATVKRHLENLLRKLKLKNRVEAAVYGLMIEGCLARDRSACALEVWRNSRKPDENGPIGS
jgi:DNA-binding CsgD family transcriptional regulator